MRSAALPVLALLLVASCSPTGRVLQQGFSMKAVSWRAIAPRTAAEMRAYFMGKYGTEWEIDYDGVDSHPLYSARGRIEAAMEVESLPQARKLADRFIEENRFILGVGHEGLRLRWWLEDARHYRIGYQQTLGGVDVEGNMIRIRVSKEIAGMVEIINSAFPLDIPADRMLAVEEAIAIAEADYRQVWAAFDTRGAKEYGEIPAAERSVSGKPKLIVRWEPRDDPEHPWHLRLCWWFNLGMVSYYVDASTGDLLRRRR